MALVELVSIIHLPIGQVHFIYGVYIPSKQIKLIEKLEWKYWFLKPDYLGFDKWFILMFEQIKQLYSMLDLCEVPQRQNATNNPICSSIAGNIFIAPGTVSIQHWIKNNKTLLASATSNLNNTYIVKHGHIQK